MFQATGIVPFNECRPQLSRLVFLLDFLFNQVKISNCLGPYRMQFAHAQFSLHTPYMIGNSEFSRTGLGSLYIYSIQPHGTGGFKQK